MLHRLASDFSRRVAFRISAAAAAAILLCLLLPCGRQVRAQTPTGDRRWLEVTSGTLGLGKRVALVIGNTHYGGPNELKNPENDARAMAHTLQALGFEVYMCLDQSREEMNDDIKAFGQRSFNASVALFYYSGHGSQFSGENYLIPIGFHGDSDDDIKNNAADVGYVFSKLAAAQTLVNVVILDACRNNPFTRNWRSLNRGLAPLNAPGGTLVAYATAPNATAEDNARGENGLYTQELLRQIKTPGLSIEDVFKNTRKAVRLASHSKQQPEYKSSLEESFSFVPGLNNLDTSAHLIVTVNAPNAKVYVDGAPITPGQETSIDLGLAKAKTIEIGVEAQGYTAKRLSLPVTAGGKFPVDVTLTSTLPPSVVQSLANPGPSVSATPVRLATLTGHTGWVTSASFSPDGRYIVTGSSDNTVNVWDAETEQLLRTLTGHTDTVNSVSFSPDSHYIVTGSKDDTVKVWDTATGALLQTLTGDVDSVTSVSFSSDGRYIVTGSRSYMVQIWNAKTGQLVQTISNYCAALSVSYSPNSRYIVTGNDNCTAKIFDAATGETIKVLKGHTNWVNSALYSPNGRYIVTASSDHTAIVWDAAKSLPVRTLLGHTGPVLFASFSHDSRYIVTGSSDHTAKVWDVATGQLLRTLTGHEDNIASASFSPNGRYIVTGSNDHTAKVWDMETGETVSPP